MLSLTRRQAEAISNAQKYPVCIWYGSVRASKTHAAIWDFVRFMSDRAQGKVPSEGAALIVGYSTNTVWRNYFVPIMSNEAFKQVAPYLKYNQNATTGTLFGQEFSVVGASNESSWMNIQGMTVAYANGDEAVSWPKSFWDMLMSRLSLPYSRCVVTCNPGSSNHYLKALLDSSDPDIHGERFLISENTTLPTSYVERTKRMYTGLFYRRMILAEWVAAEGAIYESWDQEKMVQPRKDGTVIAVGIDYGTNHPSAGYALSSTPDGLQITHEWSPQTSGLGGRTRLTDSELADSLQEWLETLPNKPKGLYIDPAAASFHEELRRRRVRTVKADNSVVDGIRQVDSLLTSGMLTIAKDCPKLIEEIPGYRWDTKAADRGKDAPVKENDDHCDGMRYAVYSSRHLWGRHVEALRRS